MYTHIILSSELITLALHIKHFLLLEFPQCPLSCILFSLISIKLNL